MPRRIPDILAERRAAGRPVFSFEVFPPKTPKGVRRLMGVVGELAELKPDYVSVTYGAGGSTQRATLDVLSQIHARYDLSTMHHLTLVGQTRQELVDIVKHMVDRGVKNILALRGDPTPKMGGSFRVVEGGLEYCYELVDLIRDIAGDAVSIGVAGFPEGHVNCPSKELDSQYLKQKIDHGAEFVVTQLFFDNAYYSAYLQRTGAVGIDVPIVPGLLPITDYEKLLQFCDRCAAHVCEDVHRIFKPVAADPEETGERGIEYAVTQGADLLARGASGLHFYALNKTEPVRTIWNELARRATERAITTKTDGRSSGSRIRDRARRSSTTKA